MKSVLVCITQPRPTGHGKHLNRRLNLLIIGYYVKDAITIQELIQ